MFGDYQKEIERRKAVIGLLVEMTFADGKVDDIEKKFVYGVAKELGLSADDIEEVVLHPEDFKMTPPPPEQERMTILYYVLFTMSVDGEIHEEEEKMCYLIGLRLGFNEHMTRDLINVMKKFLNKEVPRFALLDEIKKHMN